MTDHILILAIAFSLSYTLTALLKKHADKLRLLDRPNARSSHTQVTPRGGGLAIVAAWVVSLFFMSSSKSLADIGGLIFWLAGLPVAVVGLLDDRGHVPAPVRFAVHLLIAAWVVVMLPATIPVELWWSQAGLPSLNEGVSRILMVLGLAWLINLFNFMDGIDGIVGIEVCSVLGGAVGYFWFLNGESVSVLSQLVLIFWAATLGFLFWNFPKAKIFMGDVGSGFTGLIIGGIILASLIQGLVSIWFWVTLLGVFWVDASYTLLRRAMKRKYFWQAHRSHAYQILARRWQSHAKVSALVGGINIGWLLPLAVMAELWRSWGALFSLVALLPIFFAQVFLGAGEKEE